MIMHGSDIFSHTDIYMCTNTHIYKVYIYIHIASSYIICYLQKAIAETDPIKMTMRIKELEEENQKLHERLLNKNTTETIRFDVANYLGAGRHGRVYKVLSESKVRAAKLLHRKLLSASQSTEEVIAELDAKCCSCLGLHHPNLVEFIKVTQVDNEVTIITESMTLNLFTYLKQSSEAFSLDTQISLCISQGLQELHRIPLFHHNLHDRNILIN